MAPSRRKTVVVSDEEDDEFNLEDILSDEGNSKPRRTTSKSPAKPRASTKSPKAPRSGRSSAKPSPKKAAKSNGTVQENGKTKGTLFSFFNASTQRQQAAPDPAPVATNTKSPIDLDEVEGIDDGEGLIQVLNGSRTALAARKRKQNDVAHLFDPAVQNSAVGSQKFRKISSTSKASSPIDVDRRPWADRFGPRDLSELAVHNKKVADVRRLLEESLSTRARPRLAVLSGPAGAGKTTTLRLLAKDLGVHIRRWKNPTDVDISTANYTPTADRFEDFIFRGGSFTGLDLTADPESRAQSIQNTHAEPPISPNARSVILIEEFPVSLSRSSTILQSFRATLLAYLSNPNNPSRPAAPVFIVMSETLLSSSNPSESMAPHRLLGPTLLSHPLTASIEFNPIAPTLLTKALSLVAIKESRVTGRRRTPGMPVLSKLAEMGDIRSAIAALEFLCLRGDEGDSWSAKINFSKPKARSGTKNGTKSAEDEMTQQEREALKIVGGRESALELWHGVGKVVYNKRVDAQLAESSQRVKVPENDPEQLLVEVETDPSTFVAAVHENFVLSCTASNSESTIAAIDGCFAALSDADELALDRFVPGSGYGTALEGLRQEEISFHAGVRGVVFSLPYPVKRQSASGSTSRMSAQAMSWPQSLRLWRGQEETDDLAELCLEEYRKVLDEQGLRASASSKVSMILEQAPYMKVVHKAKGNVSTLKSHIAKLTDFGLHGMGPSINRDEEEDVVRVRRTRTKDTDAHAGIFGVEEDVKGLVLSEDDIED